MMLIAIDGPAGAGKSTVARALAERLGLPYLDTGAQFRAVGVAAMHANLAFDDERGVSAMALTLDVADNGHVTVDGIDYSALIRTPEAGQAASRVAVLSEVRRALAQRQRDWAVVHDGGVVEGRDIGSVVFPDAVLKLYITASPEVRGARRSAETGEPVAEVIASLRERDQRDKGRDEAPLQAASDAVRVDTSDRAVHDIVEDIVGLLKERT